MIYKLPRKARCCLQIKKRPTGKIVAAIGLQKSRSRRRSISAKSNCCGVPGPQEYDLSSIKGSREDHWGGFLGHARRSRRRVLPQRSRQSTRQSAAWPYTRNSGEAGNLAPTTQCIEICLSAAPAQRRSKRPLSLEKTDAGRRWSNLVTGNCPSPTISSPVPRRRRVSGPAVSRPALLARNTTTHLRRIALRRSLVEMKITDSPAALTTFSVANPRASGLHRRQHCRRFRQE